MNEENKDVEKGIDQLTGDILDGESEVSDHVVNQESVTDTVTTDEGKAQGEKPAEPAEPADKYPGLTDKHGRPFNPDIHFFDEKASFPRLNKTGKAAGKIAIKRNVKKPGKQSKVARPEKPKQEMAPKEKPEPGEEKAEVKKSSMTPDMAAKVAAAVTFRMGVLIGGEEFEPRTDSQTGLNEAEFMRQSYKDYFEAKGVTEVSPGWILVIALTTYVAPRLTMPKTQTRIQRISKSFAKAAIWIKYKLSRKAKTDGTRVDIRNDGERENDTIKEDSEPVESPGPGRDSIRPID